jgi:hypothetical protein
LLFLPALLLITAATIRIVRHNAAENSPTPVASLSANWQSSLELSAAPLANRPVFPYSIVPGGVRDAHELQAAANGDPVVANHYSNFRIAQARTIRLDRPLAMYVSYRRNNQVFWTKNRMVIPAGETLISDGENLARVRCANRLSPTATLPVAATDPSKEELNDPTFVPPLLAQLLPGERNGVLPGPGSTLPGPLLPQSPNTATNTPPPPPIFPPLLPPGVAPFIPNTPAPPPPISTPEPGSVSLFAAGAVLLSLLAVLSLRRNGSS